MCVFALVTMQTHHLLLLLLPGGKLLPELVLLGIGALLALVSRGIWLLRERCPGRRVLDVDLLCEGVNTRRPMQQASASHGIHIVCAVAEL